MGKSLFFRKRDDDVVYWRCGECGRDHSKMTGTIVKVGPDILAVLCVGCVDAVKLRLSSIAPRSFPDVDSHGIVLGSGEEDEPARRAG